MEAPRNFAKNAHKLIHALKAIISDLHNDFTPGQTSWQSVIELTKFAESFNTRNDFEPLSLSTAEISGSIEVINRVIRDSAKLGKTESAHLLSHAVHLLELYLKQAQNLHETHKKKNKAA